MSNPNFQDKTGQKVPSVTFPIRVNDEWQQRNTADIFAGKTVVVFSLPGAFTPTCSSTHLPRYNELAKVFKANGVDEIVCVSVNDTFVMNAWAADLEAQNVTLLPDGNCEFTDGMGLLVDKADLGFGKRSWRYSMLVKDGVVDKMFIEPDLPGDPFEVSDADTMLAYVAPDAQKPLPVAILSKPGCPFCSKAKALLTDKGYEYEELVLGEGLTFSGLKALSGRDSWPQVFIGGQHVGGTDDLVAFLAAK
ncbi:MAG: glutaredoxin-like protein [Paraglaciecola sp.]|jgi:glutaredoxin-like protein